MNPFTNLKPSDIPPAAEAPVETVTKMFGFLPAVVIQMAQSPVGLAMYLSNLQAFSRTSFTPIEQQVVLLATSVANRSPYSVAVHSTLAKRAGADTSLIGAVRDRRPLADPRLESLRQFTEAVTLRRGELSDDEVSHFLGAGFSRQHIVEVILGIATKTFAHILQAIALPELDDAFAAFAWRPAEVLSGDDPAFVREREHNRQQKRTD